MNTTGSDENSGSASSPFATIGKAISTADDSKDVIVYLGEGTFKDDGNVDLEIALSNVASGGSITFIGVDGKTIIDGESLKPIFKSIGSNSIVTMKNIKFINGRSPTYTNGGAIRSTGYLTIDNCVFENCDAYQSSGGAVHHSGSGNFTLTNSVFNKDHSSNDGGAIWVNTASAINVINNTFNNCWPGDYSAGTAAYISGSGICNVIGNTFYNMSSSGNRRDAGLYLWAYNGELINNTFENCIYTGNNGGITCLSGQKNYASGNKFINSVSPKGLIYVESRMNFLINIDDVSTTSPTFTLTANVTDIDGNKVCTSQWSRGFYFMVNDTEMGATGITNGTATLEVSNLLDNGVYVINATYSSAVDSIFNAGTLTVNIDRTPVDLWVDDAKGEDVETAGSESSPYKSIKYAIEQGLQKSIYVTIHINNGVYSGENNTDLSINSLCEMNILGESASETIIDGEGSNPIFTLIGSNSPTVIKNISFINAKSSERGVVINSEGNLIVDNCIFINDAAISEEGYGGAIYIENWEGNIIVNVTNSKFINCTSEHYSAVLSFDSMEGSVNFVNNTIINCSSYWTQGWNVDNGAVQLMGKDIVISNNEFINITSCRASAIDLYVYNYGGICLIDNNTFSNFSSGYRVSGVLYVDGYDEADTKITNNMFTNELDLNNANGIIYVSGGNIALKNNTFDNINVVPIWYSGGAIDVKLEFLDNFTTSHVFNLTAKVTDEDGNAISVNDYFNAYVHFYANGTEIGTTKNIVDGVAIFEASVVLENGKYKLDGTIDLLNAVEVIPATLTVDIIVNPKEYYISDAKGSDENGDGSQTKPFKTLKKAFDQAYSVDKSYDVTIHVMDGTYSGEGDVNLTLNSSCAGILRIVGDNYNKAIFDGNNNGNMFYKENKESSRDFAIPATLAVSIENITFTRFAYSQYYGSLIESSASQMNITNCVFDSIYSPWVNYPTINNPNELNINNCIFNNVTNEGNYIIGQWDSANICSVNNSTFTNCNARSAIICSVSELTNSEFINCTSINPYNNDEYPLIWSKYNAIFINNTFIDNFARGGIIRNNAMATVINNTFIGNKLVYRPAINAKADINIIDSKFINNTGNPGGAIYANAYVNLTDVTFENNVQSGSLNDIYLDNNGKVSGLTLKFIDFNSNQYLNDIVAEIISDDGAIITGGVVEFYVNNTSVGRASITNNMATVTYKFSENGKFVLNGTYNKGDSSFTMIPGEATIEVTPVEFTDLYVSDSKGSDDNDGSINSPFKTIKKAVYYAFGHENVTIHVLEGTYKDLQNTNILINTTTLNIVGGGIDETIIDGEGVNYFFNIVQGNVAIKDLTMINGLAPTRSQFQISIANIASLVLENIRYDNNTELGTSNSYGLGILNNGALTVINSTFNNNGKTTSYYDSAVIYSQYNSVLRVYNSTFSNNTGYAGSIRAGGADVIIENCNFTNHDTLYVIYSNGYDPIVIDSCYFDSNAATCVQAGVKMTNCNFTNNYYSRNNMAWYGVCAQTSGYVSDCIFINNTAYTDGGAMQFNGGEVYNCIFINNTAASMSAGAGGAMIVGGESTIGNCYFEGNQALAGGGSAMRTGGGAIMNLGNTIIMDCTFVNNNAVHRGGAIRNGEGYDNAVLTVYTSTFINNTAGNNGGAITSYMDPSQWSVIGTIHIHTSEFINNSAGVTAGAIEIFRTNADIDDCVFDGNTALNGGAISTSSSTTIATSNFTNNNAFSGGAIRIQGNVEILKSIFENNNASTGGAIDSVGGNLEITYSVFVNNTADSYGSAIFEGSANTYITDLSNNWWGINDDPNQFIFSNYTIESWVVANLAPNITEIFVGESVDFTVNFTDNNNTELADSIPTRKLIVGEEAYDLTDNSANFTLPSDEAGMVTISVDNQVFGVDVIKPTPEIEITFSKNPIYGNNITVTANVKGNDSTPTGSVIVTINNKDYEVNLTEGKAVAEIGILVPGTYPVSVNYSGDEDYANASASSSLRVSQAKPHFEIHVAGIEYGQTEIVNITADRLFNDQVLLYINGQPYDVPIVNGSGSISFEGLTPDGYTVNTYFTGNPYYVGEDAGPVTFAVSKANVKLNITASDIVVGNVERIIIESTPKVEGSLTLKLNGKMSSDSIVNGRCTVTYKNLEVDDYEFVVVYAGNSLYNTATAKATFKVTPNNIVMNSTFSTFFDENGNLRDDIKSDNLTFVGEFSNLGVDAINITKPIELIGDGAVLNDMGIIISADNVSVEDFTINLSNESGATSAIEVSGDNVTVKDNTISVAAPADADSFAVLGEEAKNLALINNTINYVGATNGTTVNNAVRLEECDGAVIENNTIDATIPSVPVTYTPPNWDATVLSEAVLVDSSDDVVFTNNKVNVDYNDSTGTYNSIYAVEFKDSDNAEVSGNEITAKGDAYAYGLTMNGDNFTVADNNISTTGNNYANGLQVNGPASGEVTGNNINAEATNVSYPVYSYGNNDVTYEDNNISGTANSVYGMELFGTNETVKDNNIVTNGNFTIGVASGAKNLVLDNNTILANGTNNGTPTTGDSIKSETTGVKVASGNATITNNDIKSNGETAINTAGSGTIANNNLVADKYTGDAAINYDPAKTTVENNTPTMYKAVISAQDIVMYYKNGTRYAVKLTDFNGKPLVNQTVTLTINGASYNRTTDENGSASLAINLGSGNYTASASYAGTGNYTDASVDNNVTILSTVYGDDIVKVFKNGTQYYATFLDGQGNPLANGTEVTFNINGVMYKRYINGNEGKARLNINLPQGEYIITAINPVNEEMHANNITVLPSIVNNNDLVKYYRNDSQYYVTIIGDDGNPVGENVTVKFNINGVFYERKTNASGVARLNINLEPGEYIITAEYNDCRVSNNITVLPVLNATDLTKKYGTADQFVARLVDGQGKPYAGQNVTFNINGVFYQRTTDSDGNAKLNINLMAGEYIITSSYNGANIANKVTVTA